MRKKKVELRQSGIFEQESMMNMSSLMRKMPQSTRASGPIPKGFSSKNLEMNIGREMAELDTSY